MTKRKTIAQSIFDGIHQKELPPKVQGGGVLELVPLISFLNVVNDSTSVEEIELALSYEQVRLFSKIKDIRDKVAIYLHSTKSSLV